MCETCSAEILLETIFLLQSIYISFYVLVYKQSSMLDIFSEVLMLLDVLPAIVWNLCTLVDTVTKLALSSKKRLAKAFNRRVSLLVVSQYPF